MFDDSRLDDEQALARVDARLRFLAESGARVRREQVAVADAVDDAVARIGVARPRAVVAAGPDSRLLRAVLEPTCPVPFVAWPNPSLPGWVGSLDLVVVLAAEGGDAFAASGVAEAVRRGSQVVVAAPVGAIVSERTTGRDSTLLPTVTGDQLAAAVVVLDLLHRVGLAGASAPEQVATALDDVAVACSPYRDLTVNPAKALASGIGDTNPVIWGGSVLAARAARRFAESIRRSTGRAAVAADAEHLLPILEATSPVDVFADPFESEGDPRPSLVVFDDATEGVEIVAAQRTLTEAAQARGVRVETVTTEAEGEVARYAALLATGHYAAAYLDLGRGGNPR